MLVTAPPAGMPTLPGGGRRTLNSEHALHPFLVAIVGGSGSGKTWLAGKLQEFFGPGAERLSLDDFYKDRSHLSRARREVLNFDRPNAIDWAALEKVLENLLNARPACVPIYDFQTHTRLSRSRILKARPIMLVEGLWLLGRRSIRRYFSFRIFLQCPARTRLRRRIQRDLRFRKRTRESVLYQFRETVEPMHKKYIAPQSRWADVVLRSDFGVIDAQNIARLITERLEEV